MSTIERPLLIVDDDPGLLRQLRWAFSDHKVYPASTRQGASEGLAILADILTIAPAAKVIIATGNETREYALRAIALGAYDFYQKPIDIDALQLIVARAE